MKEEDLESEDVLELHGSLILDDLGHVRGEYVEDLDVFGNSVWVFLRISGKAVGHANEHPLDVHSRLKLRTHLQEQLQSLRTSGVRDALLCGMLLVSKTGGAGKWSNGCTNHTTGWGVEHEGDSRLGRLG